MKQEQLNMSKIIEKFRKQRSMQQFANTWAWIVLPKRKKNGEALQKGKGTEKG